MKTLRKPQYLGTTSQAREIRALASADGSYAERHAAARAAVGKALIGSTVGLVKLGKSEFIVAKDDLPGLPDGIRPFAFASIAQCTDRGAIFLASI